MVLLIYDICMYDVDTHCLFFVSFVICGHGTDSRDQYLAMVDKNSCWSCDIYLLNGSV